MTQTKGRGVDIILNSLSDDKLQASVRCLAERGQFLEIGKYDLTINTQLSLTIFKKQASYHGVMLDTLTNRDTRIPQILWELLDQGLKNNSIKPLTKTVFDANQIEEAFRFMASGKHIGKVLLKIREEETDKRLSTPGKIVTNALPRCNFSENTSCIVIGGLGGFGLELTHWLVTRGAQNIILSSRKGITTGYQEYKIKFWKECGADVKISTEDITTLDGCRRLIQDATTQSGPVEAIFNLGMVLKDALFENQSVESFDETFGPKALATKHLDVVTRELCPYLKLVLLIKD